MAMLKSCKPIFIIIIENNSKLHKCYDVLTLILSA